MKMSNRILASLALIAALSASTLVAAPDSTGMVVALKQGDFIYIDDEIMTTNRSFVVLQFEDGAKVTVRPDSTLIIEQYVYNGNADDAAELNLVSGGLRVITGAMAKSNPENYKVRTPVALMGVRGTEFSVILCGENVCDEDGTEFDFN
jgi:hypothetical protein